MHKGITVVLSFFAVNDILIKRHSDSLGDSPFSLHSCKIRINDRSAVYNSGIIDWFNNSRLFIDLHFCNTDHERRRRYRRRKGFCCGQRRVAAAHYFVSYFFSRYLFFCFQIDNFFSVKLHIIRTASEIFRPSFAYLFPKCLTRFHNCHSRNICRTGCVRSAVIRGIICIYSMHDNIFHLTLKTFCSHLCQYRIAARSHIGRPDH